MHIKRLSNAGDTIIEVLICIAIVSTILGGAFVTTKQSQTGVRNSQEHSEALKLVESQLEQLRGDTADATTSGTPFCMYNEATYSAVIAPASAHCTQNSAGQYSQPDSRYYLTITRCNAVGCGNSIPNSYLFTVKASWPEVTGNGNAQETMVYRLY
jgi:type II secretory pathway pseudopilin PulG